MNAEELVKMSVLHPRFVRQNRDESIKRMRAEGASLQECADAYGITRERVRQICGRKQA